jgi:hypothetical protein
MTYFESRTQLFIKWETICYNQQQPINLALILDQSGTITMIYKDGCHIKDISGLDKIRLLFRTLNQQYSIKVPIQVAISRKLLYQMKNNSVIVFKPLKSCLDMMTCIDCHSSTRPISCRWKNNECIADFRTDLVPITNCPTPLPDPRGNFTTRLVRCSSF